MVLAHLVLGCWLLCCMQSVCCTKRSVYKDVSVGMNEQTHVISSNVNHTRQQLVDLMTPGDGVRLSFATGECGDETWAIEGVSTDTFAEANIGLLNRRGIPYTISTGGQKAVFTCSSKSGADRFLNRYMGPRLQGLDFYIEKAMSSTQLSNLMDNVFYLQKKNPNLIISFSLASIASTGPDATSINEIGKSVLTAATTRAGLKYVVNLMAMNFGPIPSEVICVLDDNKKCDMGESVIQAAKNLHKMYGVPFEEIALTPMIGVNGETDEIFTLDGMKKVLVFDTEVGLAGLHYWSFDRDCKCTPVSNPRTTCSGVEQKPLEYYYLLMGHPRLKAPRTEL